MPNQPNSYKIGHVSDLLKVPKDRRAACLSELLNVLDAAQQAAELLNKEAPIEQASWRPGDFTWIDDGERHIEFTALGQSLYDTRTDGQ
jgi:hypothetical protein